MSQKIYKLCMVKGMTEAYHQLTDDEKKALWDKIGHSMEQVGAKMATPYYNSRWSNEKVWTFFIIEYPDIEAEIKDAQYIEKQDWFRYIESDIILGVEEAMDGIP